MLQEQSELERKIAKIDQLIALLQKSKTSILSLRSSPINLYTELLSDIILKMAFAIEEGTPSKERVNPGIKFGVEYSYQKVSVFPYEIRIGHEVSEEIKFPKPKTIDDPELAIFLRQLAVFFSRIGQETNFKKAFHELFEYVKDFLPPSLHSEERASAEKTSNRNKKTQATRARDFYYRRQRRK